MPEQSGQASIKPYSSARSRSAPWTAARCIRSIRQLTSLLAKLEKWHKDHPDSLSGQGTSARGAESFQDKGVYKESQDVDSIVGPVFGGDLGRSTVEVQILKRRQKTYGRSARHQSGFPGHTSRNLIKLPKTPRPSKRFQPGEIPIDTPLIAGPQEAQHEQKLDVNGHRRYNTFGQQASHRSSLEPTTYDGVIQPLQTIVSSFLTATAASKAAGTGVKSLSTMCQRKLPDCILEEQQKYDSQREDVSDDRDVASVLFADLEEAFSPSSGSGWLPLREIVRAYGLRLISHAVEKQMFRMETAKQLIVLSQRLGAMDAFETFAEAWLKTFCNYTRKRGSDRNYPTPAGNFHFLLELSGNDDISVDLDIDIRKLRIVANTMRNQDCMEFVRLFANDTSMLRKCVGLLSSKKPAICLATSLIKTAILHASVPEYYYMDNHLPSLRAKKPVDLNSQLSFDTRALPDANEALSVLSTSENVTEEVEQTLRSLCIILSSIVLTQSGTDEPRKSPIALRIIEVLRCYGTWTRKRREIYLGTERDDGISTVYLHISYFFLATSQHEKRDQVAEKALECTIQDLRSRKEHLASCAGFLLDMSICCGRVQRINGFPILKRLVEIFFALSNDECPNAALFLRCAASNAAMTFAQTQREDCQFEWASNTQARLMEFLHGIGSWEPPTPGLLKNWKPYRWDHSIEEWIAETPAPVQGRRRCEHPAETNATPRSNKVSDIVSLRLQAYTQETPTPDLLILPSPPVSSPSSPSIYPSRPKPLPRNRDGGGIACPDRKRHQRDPVVGKAVKRSQSCGDAAELQKDIDRQDARSTKRARRERAIRVHVDVWSDDDEGRDELAATPAVKASLSAPRPALTAIQPRRFATGRRGNRSTKGGSWVLEAGAQEGLSQVAGNGDSDDELGL